MVQTETLEKLSLKELKDLQKETAKAVAGHESRKRAAALAELEEVAKRHGYKLKELFGSKVSKTVGPPKYQHPENPTITWSGRGRRPDWIRDGLEAGQSLEDFAI